MPLFNIIHERVFIFNFPTEKSNTETGGCHIKFKKMIIEAIPSIIKWVQSIVLALTERTKKESYTFIL